MLKFAPILVALIYGYTMYRFSAWRTKSNLDQNSRLLDDRPLRYLTDKMAKSFDLSEPNNLYNRGTYMIILPFGFNEIFLTDENYGGDFVAFKKTQGFDVEVVSFREGDSERERERESER